MGVVVVGLVLVVSIVSEAGEGLGIRSCSSDAVGLVVVWVVVMGMRLMRSLSFCSPPELISTGCTINFSIS